MSEVNDRRTEDEKRRTTGYIVATDRCLSGWGLARGGRSLYALAILDHDMAMAETVEENMSNRGDMLRVRFNIDLPRLRAGDHLSIAGPSEAGRHYERGGFERDR